MPSKRSAYVLSWSPKSHVYELHLDGVLQQQFGRDDKEAWQHWLKTLTSFAFRGQQGHLSVLKEARTRGEGYWYAYAYRGRHKKKRYLGTTRALTLTH